MQIAVPKEIKNHEYRVSLTPESVNHLVNRGHQVWVEHDAGAGIQYQDQDYLHAGARVTKKSELFKYAELIVKVKEPLPEEIALYQPQHCLFTYLHLAADKALSLALAKSGVTCIAYETVTDNGFLPLLQPMSEIAGRLSIQVGAHCLEKAQGGMGKLLGGLAGVEPAQVVVIGAGSVGQQAVAMAVGAQASVTVLDTDLHKLRMLQTLYQNQINCIYSTPATLKKYVLNADLVIGAVLIPGASAPKLIPKEWLKKMKAGAVIVDVAIDQGGCFATSKPTTHTAPSYQLDGVIHYCVTNMPGAVPLTATQALNSATLPYVTELADSGIEQALEISAPLRAGLNIYKGDICHPQVRKSLQLD
ncbi:alanine dehydrogenase [Catenovulum sediminis]|uniref:Alanine dehydrogenase n=1 Tax=Catenovulum sediminis TaxID=1740262 RepID=A0ABV1RH49_9ALTE